MSTLERIFASLEAWRHLPAYQLERRADIFFAMFLPEVLGKRFGTSIDQTVIPEFPIKKASNHLSTKVDYLALSKDKSSAFLVELKTDLESKSPKQEKILIDTAKRGLRAVVEDLIRIVRKPRDPQPRQKHVHLFYHLRTLGMLTCCNEDGLYEKAFGGDSTGVYDILDTVSAASWICDDRPKVTPLYIQPQRCKGDLTDVVDFETFASIVEEGQGTEDFRRLFASYLREWACTKAGESIPLPAAR